MTSDQPCEPIVLEQPGSGRETRPIRERDRERIREARFEPGVDTSDVTVVTFVAGDGRFADVMFVPDCRTACAIRWRERPSGTIGYLYLARSSLVYVC